MSTKHGKNKLKTNLYAKNINTYEKANVKIFWDESTNKELHAQSQQLTFHLLSIVNPLQII